MKYRAYLLVLVICLAACCSAFGSDWKPEDFAGEIEDGHYVNRALGAEAYFDEHWRVLSREDIAKLAGAVYSSSPTLEDMADGNVPVFAVVMKDGSANINLVISDLGAQAEKLLDDPDSVFMDIFMERAKQGLSKAYSEMGAKEFTVERVKTRFLGGEFPGLHGTMKVNGAINQYQKQAICIKGRYEFTITATSLWHDITDEMLAMFRKTRK